MRTSSAVLHLSLLALTGMLAVIACDSSQPKSAVGGATVPVELQPGESKFQAHCSVCHGPQGTGTQQGPPLVHKIYEPNHHGDAAFQRAAASGVKADALAGLAALIEGELDAEEWMARLRLVERERQAA